MIAAFLVSVKLFISAAAVAWILAEVLLRVSHRFPILDVPGSEPHKQHARHTPKVGGIILVITLAIMALLFGETYSKEVTAILISGSVVFVFGLLDDIKRVSAGVKFIGQLIAVILLLSFGIRVGVVQFLGAEMNFLLNFAITIIWVIGITNAINLIDSADSLAISQSLVAVTFLLVGSIIAGQEQLVNLSIIVLGLGTVLLYFNLPPARIFLGDAGAQTLGFLLASFTILYNPVVQPQASSWFVPITFLIVPIFDVCLVFFSRIRHGIPFYRADLNHTYHRLIARGLSPVRAISLMGLSAGFSGLIGLLALYQQPIVANLIFASLMLIGLIIFYFFELSNPS
jgi:UDP-GlcNAc:undecaprenyl-phosphate GlcNAc-1-phosphate transferase